VLSVYRNEAYLWIGVALLLPVVAWPLLLAGVTPEAYPKVVENWLMSAAGLLLAVVVADSVLAGVGRFRDVLAAALWVLVSASLLLFIQHASSSGWMLGALFGLHGLRSAWPLWQQRGKWWHWYAWSRDSAASLIIFYWLTHWPV